MSVETPRQVAPPREADTDASAASPSQARAAAGSGPSSAAQLLKLEAELRKVRSPAEVAYFAANELRIPTRAQQIAVLDRGGAGAWRLAAVSAVAHVDRASPLVFWLEAIARDLAARHAGSEPLEFDAAGFAALSQGLADTYPLRSMLWLPLSGLDGAVTGALLLARTTPWTEREITIARHVAGAVSFARVAVGPRETGFSKRFGLAPRTMLVAGALVVAAMAMPVSMSALAPAEVIPRDPHVVTAGIDGVVDRVDVEPNARVEPGAPLVKLVDTVFRNRVEVAEREVAVAQSRHKKAAQLAFLDVRGRQELALAQAELEVKMAERDLARDMLQRATVNAPRAGTVLYADRKDLVGRPVAAGEKLMEIADPEAVQFRIDLPVSEAIVLKTGARVKVFLDSDPLRPVDAELVRADHQARVRDGQPLAFRLVAATAGPRPASARLGVRGTAQVYSDRVPLGYYLLRRPIAALRQWVGL